MERRGLIIGVEDVLCSTKHLHRQAWCAVLSGLNMDCRGVEALDVLSLSREECLEQLLKESGTELSPAERAVLTQEKNEQYRQLLSTLEPEQILPDVMALLDDLREANVVLCVGSVSKNAVLALHHLGLDDYFDVVCDGNDLSASTGIEAVFRQACRAAGLKQENCIVWENNSIKRSDAQRAGFATVCGTPHEVRRLLRPLIPAQRA